MAPQASPTRVIVHGEETHTVPADASAPPADEQLYRELTDKFTVLAEMCARFSAEVYRRTGTSPEAEIEEIVRTNLTIAQTVFSKWALEIVAVIYLKKTIAYQDLRKTLGPITPGLLTTKLRLLEKLGIVQRDLAAKEPAQARYSLTHKGMMIARLGEPVFLYLRLAGGWRHPDSSAENAPAKEDQPLQTVVGA